MTATQRTLFVVGDHVIVNHPQYPGVWKVEKVNPARSHIEHNKGDDSISREDCIRAIEMIQDGCRADGQFMGHTEEVS